MTIPAAHPRRTTNSPVAVVVEEGMRLIKGDDLDAVAIEIDHDRDARR